MSTVIFLKDYPPHKAGDTGSVPFGTAKTLVASGVVKYPDQAPVVIPAPEVSPAIVKKWQDAIAKSDAENAKLRAELDAANKRLAELDKTKK